MITRDFVLIGRLLRNLLTVSLASALCFAAVSRADAQQSLSIAKTHSGSFTQGQPDAAYTVTVSNRNLGGPTAGAVTVTENLPSGLTLVSMTGAGWFCGGNVCTRNDVLAVGASYPAINVTVSVAVAAASPQVNMASVSGGGAGTATASDSTVVLPPSGVSLVSVPNPSLFGQAVTLTATITPSVATGRVTFYAGAVVLGVSPLSAGVAALSSIMLPAGSVNLMAFYGGDSSHGSGASNVVAESTVAQPGGSFALSTLPNAGSDAVSVAIGDFNRDGKADLAVANAGGPLTIFLGNGDGTFRAGGSFAAGANTYSVAVGDFNGDGKADLAVTDFTGGSVGVLLGNGDGTFQAVMNNPVGANPQSVVVGDFNGDGKADLAVANFYSANLSILLGNGDGTFQAAVNYSTGGGSEPYGIAVADFNGDGKADLAVSTINPGNPGGVSVLLGNGDGTFRTAVAYAAGSQPNSIVVGDFNGDSQADVAVADPAGNNIIVLLGNGDGTLRAAVSYPAGTEPEALAVGDFSGDGIADLASGNRGSSNVSVLLGNGNGTFQTAHNYALAGGAFGLAVGDFNGDARADIAAATGSNGQVAILFGAPPVTALSVAPSNGSGASQTFALNYFDAAGVADLSTVSVSFGAALPVSNPASSCQLYYVVATSQLYLYNDAGSPSLALANSQCSVTLQSTAVGMAGTGLTLNLTVNFAIPFAGAKNIYMAAAGSVSSSMFQALGSWTVPTAQAALTISKTHSGSFTQGQTGAAYTVTVSNGALANPTVGMVTVTETMPTGLTLLTMTGTGWTCTANTCSRSDILVAGSSYPAIMVTVSVAANATSPQVNSVSVSGGTSAPATATDPTAIAPLTLVSLVSAPNPSIFGRAVTLGATVTPSGATGMVTFYDGVVVLGTSSLSAGTASLSTILLPASSGKLTAYYGGDASHGAGVSNVAAQSVTALAGGAFVSGSKPSAGPNPVSLAAGDFNGDGIADMAVANNGGDIVILLGNGDGTFRLSDTKPAGVNPQAVVVGDFNGDGKADIAVANQGGNVSILLGNGDGTLQPAVNYAVGTIPFSLVVGDFNGDGKTDLAVANLLPGSVSILLGNGDGTFEAARPVALTAALPYAVAAGDFNNDGKADLVVTGVSGSVILLLGNGDGSFQPEIDFGEVTASSSIVVGDFNGDGNADVAITNGAPANNVSVFLGNGNGTFQTAATYPAGNQPESLALGDFNGDGKLDLAVGNARSPYSAGILVGNGDGTFYAAQNYPITGGALSIVVGDFNRDGIADLAVAASTSQVVDILLGALAVPPVLSVSGSHTGNFTQGQSGAVETLTVSNQTGAGPTVGTVTLTETLPAGLSLVSMIGTGWACTSNICTRSDALAGGASYPTITVTVNVGAGAGSPQVISLSVSSGGSAAAAATDSVIIQAATVTTVSVTPSSGSGLQQTFALQYADPLGAADLSSVWVWITASFGPLSNTCLLEYATAANQLYLYNDAGTGWLAPATVGAAGTLHNSQCSINMAAASATKSGTNLTLNLPVTFTVAYAGAKNTYMYAGGSIANSGWQTKGTWTAPAAGAPPTTVSVTPRSGSGLQQTFALQYADPLGATDLSSVWAWITSSFGPLSNTCLIEYASVANQLYLYNDAGTGWLAPATVGAAGTLSNSQCSINMATASATKSGTNLTLSLPMTFAPAYAGAKNTYMYAGGSVANSGWQSMGTWTVPAASGPPTTVSVTPSSGSGLQQMFALQYADPLGATDLSSVWVWITASFGPLSNTCLIEYAPVANQLYLYNDAGTGWLSPATVGAAATLSNSQCSINLATASVTKSGTNLTLNLPMTFTPAYAGAKDTYMYAGGSSAASGWQTMGTWTAPAASGPPTTVSVTPSSGSGLQQTFALQYADPLGATDLSSVWVWITAGFTPAALSNTCLLEYATAANQLYLYNDAGTGWLAPAIVGAAGTLSNSQCSINMATATVTKSGTNLTLNLPMTFTAAYSGAKNTYMYAGGSSAASGWQTMGTWTVPAASGLPTTVSVTPSSGSSLQQTFALRYADPLGATDLSSVWVWITASFGPLSNTCLIEYAPVANQLYLYNDAGTGWLASATVGAAGTLSNSQCSFNMAAASVTTSGTNLTLNLPMTFRAAYAGAKNTYMYAGGSSANSGWQTMGTWTAPAASGPPTTVSVTPNSGSGLQQTFALQYADPLGATDLSSVWVWITASFGPLTNTCLLEYARAANQLYLYNDAGTGWLSPATVGAAGTLSNSQCSINMASASVTTLGTNLTLNLPVTFAAAYAGAKNTYMYAGGSSANSGWQTMGTWTVP